jgi:GNAT superfamily N-acetyltransferase
VADGIEILVDGFLDNPLNIWLFQAESTRGEALESWFHFWLELYGEHGRLVVTDEGNGAALWAAPEVPALNEDSVGPLIEIIRRYNGDRTGIVLGGFAAVSPPKEPHWYLNAIAVRRGERARGVGARLLEPYIERSNSERIGIYLESSNPRNLTFYRRYGFVEFGPRIDLPESGPPLQPMWRPPK